VYRGYSASNSPVAWRRPRNGSRRMINSRHRPRDRKRKPQCTKDAVSAATHTVNVAAAAADVSCGDRSWNVSPQRRRQLLQPEGENQFANGQ
jgi:hypothetical protein